MRQPCAPCSRSAGRSGWEARGTLPLEGTALQRWTAGCLRLQRANMRSQAWLDGMWVGGGATKNGMMCVGVASHPNPTKSNGGEDAHFALPGRGFYGVADGVGGWEEFGVNSNEYSATLMREAERVADGGASARLMPAEVMSKAFDAAQKRARGSSTCTVVKVSGNAGSAVLQAAVLGDSTFVVIRMSSLTGRYAVVYRSPFQEHEYNMPYQLGEESDDTPAKAALVEFALSPGQDFIVLGSDGLFDNVFDEEIVDAIERIISGAECEPPGTCDMNEGVAEVAEHIAAIALRRSTSTSGDSPFARECNERGFDRKGKIVPKWKRVMSSTEGGKVDDITALVIGLT